MAHFVSHNNKSDLQSHSRLLVFVPFDFLLFFHCNYVSILHHFRDVIVYFLKFQDVT